MITFKQFSQLSNLTEDQVTEEKLEEIFGAFFGGKSQPDKDKAVADLKAKKAGTQQAMNKNTAALSANKGKLDKNKQWMDWVAAQKADQNRPAKKLPAGVTSVPDKQGERRASDFAYAQRGMKEGKEVKVPYKGYSIMKKDSGTYHITKGPRFIGHAKDHQEAMKKIDAEAGTNEDFVSEDIHAIGTKVKVRKPGDEHHGRIGIVKKNRGSDEMHKVVFGSDQGGGSGEYHSKHLKAVKED